MAELDPWYKVAVPRDEVRQGRSFNPDEFAIHLEQVVAKKGTEDYRDPEKFFLRNVFTRALATLYHLATSGKIAAGYAGVSDLLTAAGLSECPTAKVGAFVGNAWDPKPGLETPWLDLADQLAGPAGIAPPNRPRPEQKHWVGSSMPPAGGC